MASAEEPESAWHAMLAKQTGQRASGAAGGASAEYQNRRRLVARRGLRWGALGAPSASVGPLSACRLPSSVLSCSQAQSQSPLLHGCNALGTPLYLYKNGIAPHLDFAVTVQTVVMSQRTQLSNHSQAIQACSSVQAEAVSRVSDVLG